MVNGGYGKGSFEPGIVDCDCHRSAEGLAQPSPLKGKENNLDIIDNDDLSNKE